MTRNGRKWSRGNATQRMTNPKANRLDKHSILHACIDENYNKIQIVIDVYVYK